MLIIHLFVPEVIPMRFYFYKLGKEKYLDVSSARRSRNGDIEVLSSNYNTAYSVYLIEYELEWFVVIEEQPAFPDDPPICGFHSYRIENQLDAYKLNAIL